MNITVRRVMTSSEMIIQNEVICDGMCRQVFHAECVSSPLFNKFNSTVVDIKMVYDFNIPPSKNGMQHDSQVVKFSHGSYLTTTSIINQSGISLCPNRNVKQI